MPTLIERLAAAAAPSDRLFPHDDPRVGGLFKTAGGPAYQEGLPGALAELLAPRCACLSAPHDGCADWCIAAHRRAGGSAERAANESNGLLVVGDFLPPDVAARSAAALCAIDDGERAENEGGWSAEGGGRHAFRSASAFPNANALFDCRLARAGAASSRPGSPAAPTTAATCTTTNAFEHVRRARAALRRPPSSPRHRPRAAREHPERCLDGGAATAPSPTTAAANAPPLRRCAA